MSWQLTQAMNLNQNREAQRIILAALWGVEVSCWMTGSYNSHRLLISISERMIHMFWKVLVMFFRVILLSFQFGLLGSLLFHRAIDVKLHISYDCLLLLSHYNKDWLGTDNCRVCMFVCLYLSYWQLFNSTIHKSQLLIWYQPLLVWHRIYQTVCF